MAHQNDARSGERLHNVRWHRIYLTLLCGGLVLTAANLRAQVAAPLQADSSTVMPDGTVRMPPTLFLTSTRDQLLSGTTILHRAFLRAGNDAQFVVFEALTHAFWNDASLPETKEADEIMARFFVRNLGR